MYSGPYTRVAARGSLSDALPRREESPSLDVPSVLFPPTYFTRRELADLTAPPLIDEGIRKLSLVSDLDRFFSNLYE